MQLREEPENRRLLDYPAHRPARRIDGRRNIARMGRHRARRGARDALGVRQLGHDPVGQFGHAGRAAGRCGHAFHQRLQRQHCAGNGHEADQQRGKQPGQRVKSTKHGRSSPLLQVDAGGLHKAPARLGNPRLGTIERDHHVVGRRAALFDGRVDMDRVAGIDQRIGQIEIDREAAAAPDTRAGDAIEIETCIGRSIAGPAAQIPVIPAFAAGHVECRVIAAIGSGEVNRQIGLGAAIGTHLSRHGDLGGIGGARGHQRGAEEEDGEDSFHLALASLGRRTHRCHGKLTLP